MGSFKSTTPSAVQKVLQYISEQKVSLSVWQVWTQLERQDNQEKEMEAF